MDTTKNESKSPTQVMVETLEEFGNCEPVKVLIIYFDEEGIVKSKSSTMYNHERLGLIEMVKASLLDEFVNG